MESPLTNSACHKEKNKQNKTKQPQTLDLTVIFVTFVSALTYLKAGSRGDNGFFRFGFKN